MIQAAVLGVIDFSKARFYDPWWRRQVRLKLLGLERKNNSDYASVTAGHYAALLSAPNLEVTQWNKIQDRAIEAVYQYQYAFDPSQFKTAEEREKGSVRRDVGRWQQRYGDLRSPEVQDRIRRTAEALQELGRQTRQEEQRSMAAIIGLSKKERERVASKSSRRR